MKPNPDHCVFVCVAYDGSTAKQLADIQKQLLVTSGISIVTGPIKASDPLFELLCEETRAAFSGT